MRHLASLASLSLLAVLAACGGDTTSDTGSNGAGGSSAGAGGSSAGAGGSITAGAGGSSAGAGGSSAGAGGGDACGVPGQGAGPYDVTFTLTNPSAKSIWLWQDCQLSVSISSCPDFETALTLSGACTADCKNFMGCIACGPCMSAPTEVPPGGSKTFSWSGSTYTFGTVMGCSCHEQHTAPAGKYRLTAQVWDAEPPPNGGKPAPDRTVTHDFELSSKGGTASVSLAP